MNKAAAILAKHQKLSPADIQFLRENAAEFRDLALGDPVPTRARMELELVDAIDGLNRSTTKLMWVAIMVAVVGVLVTAAQIFIAVKS